ncbi:MAG TPA: amidohydrolase family protein [Amycolatopsis sp.]|nr:amidohydrolase family protein [Amycolatopsis sp.]
MRTALRASWLFDGTTLRPDPVVVLDGERIAAVEYGAVPHGLPVTDLTGATLLPGLVDTHVHLAFDAGPSPVQSLAARSESETLAAMADAARTALRGGVTTVRDLGDRDYLTLRLRETPGPLPTILAAGPPITTPAGHCHYLGGEAEPGAAGMRAAVREHVERGVDVIKIMASGGTLTPGTHQHQAQFSVEELAAAVDEAHRHGLPVTAHAHATQAIVNAVHAGVDGLEHVSFWSAEGIDDPPQEVVRAFARGSIVLGTTLGIVRSDGGPTPPPAVLKRLPLLMANLKRLHDEGALIAVGTDAGIGPPKPHDVLRHAIPQLGAIGFDPAEALRTATEVGARVCGLGDRKGRLCPGFDADVLAVDGDPLADPGALHRIRAVYARGSLVGQVP